jgi:hypothetical protein
VVELALKTDKKQPEVVQKLENYREYAGMMEAEDEGERESFRHTKSPVAAYLFMRHYEGQ